MNAKQLFAVAALAVAGFSGSAAFANEADYAPQAASTLSRAEVRAELAQAVADKTLPTAAEYASVAVATPHASALSRQDVRAQTREYVRSGQAYQDQLELSLGN